MGVLDLGCFITTPIRICGCEIAHALPHASRCRVPDRGVHSCGVCCLLALVMLACGHIRNGPHMLLHGSGFKMRLNLSPSTPVPLAKAYAATSCDTCAGACELAQELIQAVTLKQKVSVKAEGGCVAWWPKFARLRRCTLTSV